MRGLNLLTAGVLLIGAGIFSAAYRNGPWIGRYYPNLDHSGTPELLRAQRLAFDWRGQPPLKDFPRDGFSIQWDTCLRVEAPQYVRFLLTSDEQAVLSVDGQVFLDNGDGAWRNSRTVTLAPGAHHLSVAYADQTGLAQIALEARGFTRWEDPLTPRRLFAPELTSEHPCDASH